jgi:translation initiation factor 5A
MSTSKTGKHGSAKCHLIGLDIFTGKKIEAICGSTDDVTFPDLDKVDMLVRVVSRVCVIVVCVCDVMC